MNKFMDEALKQAEKALKKQEVPIGAVVVKDGKIISTGYNCRERKQNAIKHAEIIAIEKASKKLKSWRLEDCEIYITLEPCPMCAGAILNARIKKAYYGAKEKTSDDDILKSIVKSTRLNHNCEIIQLEEYEKICSQMLTKFFKEKRQKN